MYSLFTFFSSLLLVKNESQNKETEEGEVKVIAQQYTYHQHLSYSPLQHFLVQTGFGT